jgi:hypothetical protein
MVKGLLIADTHIGSFVSLMPKSVIIKNVGKGHTVILANPVQRKILRHWDKMCSEGPYDFVVVNGDICEGPNYKQTGHGNWTNNIDVQIEVAVQLLKMIPCKKFYITQGSPYHTGENMSSDQAVAKLLYGAEFGDELSIYIKKEDYRIHVMHKIGVSTNMAYRGTPLSKEMMVSSLEADKFSTNGQGFNLICRAHSHYFWHNASSAKHQGISLPCWKGRDSFVARRTLAFCPHVGYIVTDIKNGAASFDVNLLKLRGKELIKECEI